MNVNSSDSTIAASILSVERAAYSGRWIGASEIGLCSIEVIGASTPRLPAARNAISPITSSSAIRSKRDGAPRRAVLQAVGFGGMMSVRTDRGGLARKGAAV